MESPLVVISDTMSTTTLTSTAGSRVMVQVRVRGVPAVRGEGGVLRDTPGTGTVGRRILQSVVRRQLYSQTIWQLL